MATTYSDTNTSQLVINKLTKTEYENLSSHSATELYLVEEQVDSVVTQNSTNPVQSGAVYEALQQSSSNIKDGITTFTKNNETIGTTSANQSVNQTIALPNDVEMVYFVHSKALSVQTTDAYYDTNYNYLVEEDPATWTDPNPQHRITTDGYYYDLLTDNIYQVDNYETTEVTSNVTIQGDIHKLYVDKNTNKAYRWDGGNFILLYENEKEIVDNLIIANNFAYPLEGTYIGQVESTEPPLFYDRKAADFHTFVSQDNGKYFYDDIDNKVYIYIEQPNQHLYCVSDNELYYLENLDTTKTYLSYKTDKLYRTNNGENFNLIATTDYIDLKNKPLSVESGKVKYTLSDGTTKLTLAQESNVKDIPITFTPDTTTARAIIQTGDTIATIVQKIAKKVVITPTFINTPSNPDRLKITLNYNVVLISAYDLVFPNGLNDGDKICNLPFVPSIQWNYSIYLNNSSGVVNPIYVVSVDGVTSLAIKGTVNAGQGISFTLTVF